LGRLVNRRIVLGAVMGGAFIVTLAFSSWHEGLWDFAADPPVSAVPQPGEDSVLPAPVAPSATDPSSQTATVVPPSVAAAAIKPPSATAAADRSQPETSQSDLYEEIPNPGVDTEAIRRDRGVQHSSGSH
jgi:hypothetical protein